jgi:integrase
MLNGKGEIMPRKVKSRELDSRDARSRLKPRGMPYYKSLDQKLHLGYRRIKSKSGTWWARHYLGGRQYDVEPIGTADDQSPADGIEILDFWQAQDKARARMGVRVSNGAGKIGPLTVKDAIEDYLQFLETNRKPSTARDSRYRAAAFILPGLGEMEVAELTTERLERWLAGIAKTAPRVRTRPGDKQQHREIADGDDHRQRKASANRLFTILKAALNRSWRRGKVASDAAWRRVEPFENVDAARIRYLTVEEANRLVNACDEKFRPLVQAALQTGARYGELARLQVHDFNRDAGTVAIRQSKSGRPRHIVLTDEGRAFFEQLTVGRAGNEPMLGKWGDSHQRRPMLEAVKRAKIKPAISFHGLRHTWASLAVRNGVPLMIVARNLGHTDTRMAEKHYAHLAPDYIKEAIREGAPRFGFKPDNIVTALR